MNTWKWLVAVMLSLLVGFNTGAATVTVAGTGYTNQNVAVNVPNQFLGQFTTTTVGEPVRFSGISFVVNTTNLISNITLVDWNGSTVAGPVDTTVVELQSAVVFTDAVTVSPGTHTYVVKGRLSSSFANGEAFSLSTAPSTDWQGGVGRVTGNPVTASPSNIVTSVTVTAFGGSSVVSPRISKFTVTTNVPLGWETNGTFGIFTVTNSIAGYEYGVDESTDFVHWYELAKVGSVADISGKVVSVHALLGTNARAFYRLVSKTPSGLTVSTDSSSPAYQVATGGDVGVVTTVAKFRALYEPVNLMKVALRLSYGSQADVVQATIWDGATKVGSAVFIGTSTQAVATLTTPVLVPKDADKLLTVRIDLSNIGIAEPVAESGHLVAVDVDTSKEFPGQGTTGFGVQSGQTIKASGKTTSSGVRVFKSYPTFTLDPLPSTGVADGRLLRFKVTSNVAGPIGLEKFALSIATTSATVSGVVLYGYIDQAYSQHVMNGSALMVVTADGTNIVAYPQNNGLPLELPAVSTYYFEVRGSVAVGGANYSVIARLLGDGSYAESQNFIWSPNSRDISTLNDADWFNGYGLPGLPSSGLIQTRAE